MKISRQHLDSSTATLSETAEPFELRDLGFHSILSPQELSVLNTRSDRKGWQQLVTHLVVLGSAGAVWGCNWGHWWIALPALGIYGFSLASMFAALHECVHRTAFAHPRLNEGVAWFAGVLSFYNSTFYRRYHQWHHRYNQIPGKDPELEDLSPAGWISYLWLMSGIPWWLGKIHSHVQNALGQFESRPYIPDTSQTKVMRSTWAQLAIYGGMIALSIMVQQPWFVTYWLLPLVIGQPMLRFLLIAEHTGCSQDTNPLANTRTTLTIWPIRLLMWNMSFHAEHHLYVSIPFHALPHAHEQLKGHFKEVAVGYVSANRQIIAQFSRVS